MVGDYRGNYSRRSSDDSDDASSVASATTSSLNINVKEPEYRLSTRQGGSHEFLRSPWIKHYKSLPKNQVLVTDEGCSELRNQVVSSLNGTRGYSSGSASSVEQICFLSSDRDQIIIGQEVSDQNFINEVTKDENEGLTEMKTVMSESSNTDQVVPLRKTHAT